jgi:predicted deacylase
MADHAVVFPAPGEKERRVLAFGSRILAGYEWPYFAISGATDGPTLGLIAGIHGAEYPPIDAVMQFCRALDPTTLRGRSVAVPVVNLPAFWQRTPFVCPNDGKNPKRVFRQMQTHGPALRLRRLPGVRLEAVLWPKCRC